MSALRIHAPGDPVRFVDVREADQPAPLRGYSFRGQLVRPLPSITPELRAKWREDGRRQRAARAARRGEA